MNQSAYAAVGVGIRAGDRAIELTKVSVACARRPEVLGKLGGFTGFFDTSALKGYVHPVLAISIDGVGMKAVITQVFDRHDTTGFDLVGIPTDDLVVRGAKPLFVTDYIVRGRAVPERTVIIVSGIVDACVAAGRFLVGEETAEHPGLLGPGKYDVVGATIGIVERDAALGADRIETGDVVLAVAFSGLHSNGCSLVWYVLLEQAGWWLDRHVDELGHGLGGGLLTPTRVYALGVLTLICEVECHAFSHITGSELANSLARVIPAGRRARLKCDSWSSPVIFRLIQQVDRVSQADIEVILNIGVGTVAILPETGADAAVALLGPGRIDAWVLGRIETHGGPGIAELVRPPSPGFCGGDKTD